MIVYAPANATIASVEGLIGDLSWVGGCRDPDSPGFKSLTPSKVRVSRAKDLDLHPPKQRKEHVPY